MDIQALKNSLIEYYESQGIIPGDSFACKCFKNGLCKGDLARGMQCHVGSRYGDKMKILVAALDCGDGGASNLEDRTKEVMTSAYSTKRNPHMRGTFQALSYFLNNNAPSELVHYMVMINTCKCCHIESNNHLSIDYYLNCGEYTIHEIALAQPDVILFQGQFAPAYCIEKGLLKPVAALQNNDTFNLKDYLKVFQYNGFKCYSVLCIHPSARGRSAKKRSSFYNETLPIIADYIKKNPLD